MSSMPICDAINNQFDQWDKQIEELKNKTKEAAKEQAEKIKKDIQEYTKKKTDELTSQKTETEAKKQALAVPTPPTSPDDVVSACTKIITCLESLISQVASITEDIKAAPDVLLQRSSQSIDKLAQI